MSDIQKKEGVKTEKSESSGSGEGPMSSLYYLSPSDNPGTLITPVMLTGDNYAEWSVELENALRAKRKTAFIDGSFLMPSEVEDSVNVEKWKTVNSMIVGWIRASIHPTVRSTVTFTSDAFKMWNALKSRFSVGNAVRIHQLKAELAMCRQNGSTVLDYFGRLSKKWEELSTYKPLPTCTCGASEKYATEHEEEKVHQFLMGLDDSRFGNVCTNIIGLESLPDLNSVYQRVVREERRIGATRSDQNHEAVGFVARSESVVTDISSVSVAAARSRSSVVCSHCGRSGHDKRECWQLIGFPEWYTERNQSSGERGRGGAGRGRGRGRAVLPRSNVAQTNPTMSIPQLSSEQWASLNALLEQQRPTTIPNKLNGPFYEDLDWSR